MYHKICRCCGLHLTQASISNPNICRDCEHFTTDDSPIAAARSPQSGSGAGMAAQGSEYARASEMAPAEAVFHLVD